MWALLLAIFGVLLFGGQSEGTIRASGILASVTLAKVGRLCVGMWSYRPGRVYYRLAVV